MRFTCDPPAVIMCPVILALAIANLRKGLRLVFSSPHPPFAEIGKSKNVNLDFLFVDNIM